MVLDDAELENIIIEIETTIATKYAEAAALDKIIRQLRTLVKVDGLLPDDDGLGIKIIDSRRDSIFTKAKRDYSAI